MSISVSHIPRRLPLPSLPCHPLLRLFCLNSLFLVDTATEYQLVVQALRLNTLSKLTFADSKRFDALVGDVFTNIPFKDVVYRELDAALREVCCEMNLEVIESQVRRLRGRGRGE